MIRGFSLFITILFLASNASATHRFFMIETGDIWHQLDNGSVVLKAPQSSEFWFQYRNRQFVAPWRFEMVYVPVREEVTPNGTFEFIFDTDDACNPLVLQGCEQFSTFIELDNNPTPVPTVVNGLEVSFAHEAGAGPDPSLGFTDGVGTRGKLVFSVSEELIYSLSSLYEILGVNVQYARMHLAFYEARKGSHPVDGSNPWAEYEWFPLVMVSQTTPTGGSTDVVLGFPNDVACNGCADVGTDFTGILHPGNIYSLEWETDVVRGADETAAVFPTGNVSLVVPEPSSDLMGFAGLLGLAFLGRRRALAAKVS